MLDVNKLPNSYPEIIEEHYKCRLNMIELNTYITNAMEEYLKIVGETEKFTLRFEDSGTIKLDCDGDLFNLEQIGGFCDMFNLELIINNRTVVENHLDDRTDVRTRYLFTTKRLKETVEED